MQYMNFELKQFVLSILCIILYQASNGQESKKYQKLKNNYDYSEGKIILKDSTMVIGLIKCGSLFNTKIYNLVTIVTQDGIKEKYKPKDVLRFNYSINKFESDEKSFYKVIIKGNNVTLYQILYNVNNGYSSNQITEYFLKKTNESIFKRIRKSDFRMDISYYFNDCTALSEKIRSKEYKYKDIRKITTEYNQCELELDDKTILEKQ